MDNVLINTCPSVLLIGYGNDLRGDDAAGLRVSDAIARMLARGFLAENPSPVTSGDRATVLSEPLGNRARLAIANVSTFCVHQLTPELAEILAKVDIAIFVDAYPATAEQTVRVCPIELTHTNVTMGHSSNPSYLLTLTQTLYGCSPQAWWVMVPGVNFELGDSLSPVAQQGVEIALEKIDDLIKTVRKELCMKLK
jgi:Ni,Fe-hydrogenase maturation factor